MTHEWRVQLAMLTCRRRANERETLGSRRLYLAVRELWGEVWRTQAGFYS